MAGRLDLDLYNDRSRWPGLIRGGYDRATKALDAFRPRRRQSRAAAQARATV